MKRHVWSNPELQWEGFQPVAYWFDTEKIWALPLSRKYEGGKDDEPTTFGDIVVLLRDKQLKLDSFERGVLDSEFVAADDSLKVTVKGGSFNRDLLRIILQLHSEGISVFDSTWYYFDHDSCRQDPHEMYSFFVVAKNKIVRERIGFSDYLDSGFNPTIFEAHDHEEMIWGDEPHWDEAATRYWYRKFYTETRTGQLMTLRPDDPPLFYYERTGPDLMGAVGVLQPVVVADKVCSLDFGHRCGDQPSDSLEVVATRVSWCLRIVPESLFIPRQKNGVIASKQATQPAFLIANYQNIVFCSTYVYGRLLIPAFEWAASLVTRYVYLRGAHF